jgi:O-antigen/teichoic acid export membrane protein
MRAAWSAVDAAAAPLASLALTAGLVRSLGAEEYGVLIVILAASTLSLTINAAISATTIKLISEGANQTDPDKSTVARPITAALVLVTIIGFVLLGATSTFSETFSHLLFGDQTGNMRTHPPDALVLGMLVVCLQQIDGVFGAALKGFERFKQQALFEVLFRTITAAVAIFVGAMTHDLKSVLASMCAASAFFAVGRAVLLRTIIPSKRMLARPGPAELSRIAAFGGWMWLSATATVAYTAADRIIVGRFLGSSAAAEFYVYVQLCQLIHYIPSSLFAFSFPMFSRLNVDGSRNQEVITTTYRKLLLAIVTSALFIAITLAFTRQPLLGLLSGGVFPARGDTTFLLVLIGFAVLALNVAPYYLLLGLGRSKAVSLVTAVSILVAVGLALLLVPSIGLEGAALARFGYCIGSLILLHLARRALARL